MKQFSLFIVAIFLLFSSIVLAQDNIQVDSLQIETISNIADSLIISENVTPETASNIVTAATETQVAEIIPSQGISFTSIWRGILGMISLVFIAFLFSSNRKAIDWKIVGIGLSFQLLIAIGVLKVAFIKNIFEFVGGLFVSVLDFTRAGSKFLFEGLVVDMDTFGFIFAFQVPNLETRPARRHTVLHE